MAADSAQYVAAIRIEAGIITALKVLIHDKIDLGASLRSDAGLLVNLVLRPSAVLSALTRSTLKRLRHGWVVALTLTLMIGTRLSLIISRSITRALTRVIGQTNATSRQLASCAGILALAARA